MHLISFKDLFEIFSKSIQVEERMLLFYLILVENESFRVYVLSRTDQETIVSLNYAVEALGIKYSKFVIMFSICLY